MENRVNDYAPARRRMVQEQLLSRGIKDPRVLGAMEKVPREAFVASGMSGQAYADYPLNIGERQTISQPYIVARMTEALELTGGEKVLEIGTGSGYQTAILLELAKEVYSIERLSSLSHKARRRLYDLGYDGFSLRIGDGTLGWPEAAPFDAIIVTAATPRVPGPYQEQLAKRGRMVIPIGTVEEQELMLYKKVEGRLLSESLGGCRFVRLIGDYAWSND